MFFCFEIQENRKAPKDVIDLRVFAKSDEHKKNLKRSSRSRELQTVNNFFLLALNYFPKLSPMPPKPPYFVISQISHVGLPVFRPRVTSLT